jgi:hypothetical protein
MGRAVPVIAPSQLSFVFPLVTFVTLLWGSEFVVRQHHQLIFSGQTLSFVRAVTFFRYCYDCRLAFVLGKRINGDSGVIIVNNHILSLYQCYHLLFELHSNMADENGPLQYRKLPTDCKRQIIIYIILLIFLWQLSVHRCWLFQVVGGCCTVVHTMPSYAPLPV